MKSLLWLAQREDPSLSLGHIVLVDDDPLLRQLVTGYFEYHSLPTKSAANGLELLHHFKVAPPSLIILDLRPGQNDGLDLVMRIRSLSNVPIILMIGNRIAEIDRVVGLELGADAYITKPFSLRELLARVRAVLRRQEMGRCARASERQGHGYRFNGWVLERRGRRLVDPGAISVALSKSEYDLLLAFLESPQRTLTRGQLLQAIRMQKDIFGRSIDVRVLRLRRKLETDPSEPRVIETVRGTGYIFTPSVDRL
jgi:two-component system, OmpR family, response regulator